MREQVPLHALARRRLRPVFDVHAAAAMLAVEAVAVGPAERWSASVLERLTADERGALGVMGATKVVPDAVFALEHRGLRPADRVAAIARTPVSAIFDELALAPPDLQARWASVAQAPERWLVAVCGALARTWPLAHALLTRDRDRLGRLAFRVAAADTPGAVREVLCDLHRASSATDSHWELRYEGPQLGVVDDGLVVIPALTTPDRSVVGAVGEQVRVLVAGVSTGVRDHVALEALLGGIRAQLLRHVDRPTTMGEVAEALRIAAGAATHHVKALEDMGLVQRRRRGRFVEVRRTERGARLLRAYAIAPLSSRDAAPALPQAARDVA